MNTYPLPFATRTPALRTVLAVTALLGLQACAHWIPPAQVTPAVAPQWHAPLPHQGDVQAMGDWWRQQGDALLVELIEAAQVASPTVSQAVSRMATARANQAAAQAALLPQVSAQMAASRGVTQPGLAVATTQQVGLQASWELDLIGANRAVRNAAIAQLQSSQAQWHDARVLVAAEVANRYYALNTCSQQLALARRDAQSRQETARLTEVSAKAGFLAPSVAAMARASAADSNSRAILQQALCDSQVKAMVALTALDEPVFKQKMAAAPAKQAWTASIKIANLPAQTIAQRPDVFAAERDVVLASAQVGNALALRLPRLSLNGSIGALRVQTDSMQTEGSVWSFGPVSVSLPVFDAGQRAANVDAARAAYQTAVLTYQSKVRNAVREVEESLVALQSTQDRNADALTATRGYAEALAATQARFGQGLASLVELEDARRNALAAESGQLGLQLERQQAWVGLYRAVGGGFDPQATAPIP